MKIRDIPNGYSIFFLIVFTLLIGCQKISDDIERVNQKTGGDFLVDGKKIFIIGSYHHPKSKNSFKSLKDNGYNLVKVSKDELQLDSAAKYGLMTWITTGSIDKSSKTDSLRIAEIVNKYKNHSSLLFWEIEDEPAFKWNSENPRVSSEEMLDTYSLIKSIDNQHYIYTNHAPVNLVSTLRKYNQATDIVACDVYPVIPRGITPTYALFPDGLQGDLLNTYISQVGEYVEKMKRVTMGEKPVFMVLQGFAWEMLKPGDSRNSEMVKYPTYSENRFMAFNAIIHGASGLIYWGTNYTPQSSAFMKDLDRVTKELSQLKNILVHDSHPLDIKIEYHELGYSVDAGVEWILKEYDKKIYLITTNSDRTPAKVTFSGFQSYNYANVMEEDRILRITNGSFIDYYDEFAVHIYEISE